LVDEDCSHRKSLTINAKTIAAINGDLVSGQISQVYRLDDDARPGEQRFGDAPLLAGRRTRLSEDVNSGAMMVDSGLVRDDALFSASSFDDVVDGPVKTTTAARDRSGGRPQLKRHALLSKAEAKDRRSQWVMKRDQTARSTLVQDRDKSATVSRDSSSEDDHFPAAESEKQLSTKGGEECSLATTDAVVSSGDQQRLTCSLACCQIDSCTQVNSCGCTKNSDDHLPDREGTGFVFSAELTTETLEATEDMQRSPSQSILSEPEPSEITRQVSEVVSTRQHADETTDSMDNDRSGGETPVRPKTSLPTLSPSSSVTDTCHVFTASSVYDSSYKAESQEMELVIPTTLSLTANLLDRPAESRVAVTPSSINGAAFQHAVTHDEALVRCNPGVYRTSYNNSKSEPGPICSPGSVKCLINLFEHVTLPSVNRSSAAVERTPVVTDSDEQQWLRDDARHSISSHGHRVRSCTSSDSSPSISSDLRQHFFPVLQQPANPVHHRDHLSDLATPRDADDTLNAECPWSADEKEVRTDLLQLRLSSSLRDDVFPHRYCLFASAATHEFDDDVAARPARRSLSDPVRSSYDLLSDRRYGGTTQFQGVDATGSGKDLLGVRMTHDGKLTSGPGCVNIIAWHKPNHLGSTARRTPASGHERTAFLKHGMYRQGAGMCGRLRTVEIARHKPERF